MKVSQCLAAMALLAAQSSAISILLPLYVYPEDSLAAWNSAGLFSTIAAYPDVQWQIIVNPASGPGNTSANPYPDSNYIAGISKLNSYSNVQTIGYVDTATGGRPYSSVTADIQAYANWANYSPKNIAVKGIFFDDFTVSTTQASYTYASNITNYAHEHVSGASVIFNPGGLSPVKYFDYADTIVEFENYYSDYASPKTISSISASGAPLGNSAVLIHDTTATSATIDSLVHTLNADGVEFIYFTQDCCYNAINAAFLLSLAAAVNAG
ncbi:hypothetical protein HWV62_24988 [Athelia sp. TMB]|nr:hypothetical protein HWV62_39950 [Athelia sp. TMB]KAF7970109.1 hypothetical protein HWV62_24988 [Athelia sp. TMB]